VSISADQLAFTLDALRPGPIRREPRKDTVRIVEYTRFPRVGPDPGPRIGFTRDLSTSGMCIGTDEAEIVGASGWCGAAPLAMDATGSAWSA
jgi:hypothetical protein